MERRWTKLDYNKLVSSWVDDDAITPKEASELSAVLKEDAEARKLYLQQMSIHAELCSLESAQDYLAPIAQEMESDLLLDPNPSSVSWGLVGFLGRGFAIDGDWGVAMGSSLAG